MVYMYIYGIRIAIYIYVVYRINIHGIRIAMYIYMVYLINIYGIRIADPQLTRKCTHEIVRC